MYRVIVAGSRSIQCQDIVFRKLDCLLARKIEQGETIQIISGTARGADQMGERYAAARGFPCARFPANWVQYGRRAGYLRNCEMAQNADALVAFWDGQSPGTRHMIQIAEDRGLAVRVIRIHQKNKGGYEH